MKKPVIGAVVGVLVVVAVVVVVMRLRKGGQPKIDKTIVVELRPKPGDPDSAVDPMFGKMLFEHNCTTCHGWRGEGNGPTDPYLWRRPRNLADASYMNSRTDEQLMDVLSNGGAKSKSQLSRVMPAWSTTFNSHHQADILAWVRRLSPAIEDFVAAGDFTRYEAVLSDARAGEVKSKSASDLLPGERTVVFYAVWSDKKGRPRRVDEPAPALSTPGLAGYVAFTRVELGGERVVSLGLAISPEKKVHKCAVFEKVTLLEGKNRNETAVDEFAKAFQGHGDDIGGFNPAALPGHEDATKALGGAVKRLYWRLVLAIDQDKDEWDEIKAGKKPNESHPGREVYDRMNCWQCHGPTGRAKGPGVAAREPQPANFADEGRMGALTDAYIMTLLKEGGPTMNISGVMPSYDSQMTDDEKKALIQYLRTLAPASK